MVYHNISIFTKLLISSFLCLLFLDAIWLSFTVPRFYDPVYRKIQCQTNVKYRMYYGLVAWSLLALSATILTTTFHREKNKIPWNGALCGFIIYGVYNFTMLATIQKYPFWLAITDTLWGTTAMCITTLFLSYLLTTQFFKITP